MDSLLISATFAAFMIGFAASGGCRRAAPQRPTTVPPQPYVCDWTQPGRTVAVTDGRDMEMIRKLGITPDRMRTQPDPSVQNLGSLQIVLMQGTAIRLCCTHLTVWADERDSSRYDLVGFRSFGMSGQDVMRWIADLPEPVSAEAASNAAAFIARPGPRTRSSTSLFEFREGGVTVHGSITNLGYLATDPYFVEVSLQFGS
jgi:hypothetical protein